MFGGMKSPLDKARGYEVVWANVAPLFDAACGVEAVCFVYLIGEEDGPFKIGLAKNPISRLRSMQTGNPRRLRVERVVIGDMLTEKLLHEIWEPYAIRSPRARAKGDAPGTEWFTPDARPAVDPILANAARWQVDYLSKCSGETAIQAFDAIVRMAHEDITQRDDPRLLGAEGGYVSRRVSRL